MEAQINNITLWHSFPNTLGSLTITWSSDSMNEIMVVADHPISVHIPTLYVSGQGGQNFAQAAIPGTALEWIVGFVQNGMHAHKNDLNESNSFNG